MTEERPSTRAVPPEERPMCERCGQRAKERRRGKSGRGYYRLCSPCRKGDQERGNSPIKSRGAWSPPRGASGG